MTLWIDAVTGFYATLPDTANIPDKLRNDSRDGISVNLDDCHEGGYALLRVGVSSGTMTLDDGGAHMSDIARYTISDDLRAEAKIVFDQVIASLKAEGIEAKKTGFGVCFTAIS